MFFRLLFAQSNSIVELNKASKSSYGRLTVELKTYSQLGFKRFPRAFLPSWVGGNPSLRFRSSDCIHEYLIGSISWLNSAEAAKHLKLLLILIVSISGAFVYAGDESRIYENFHVMP